MQPTNGSRAFPSRQPSASSYYSDDDAWSTYAYSTYSRPYSVRRHKTIRRKPVGEGGGGGGDSHLNAGPGRQHHAAHADRSPGADLTDLLHGSQLALGKLES